jgi:hypothetical protein
LTFANCNVGTCSKFLLISTTHCTRAIRTSAIVVSSNILKERIKYFSTHDFNVIIFIKIIITFHCKTQFWHCKSFGSCARIS